MKSEEPEEQPASKKEAGGKGFMQNTALFFKDERTHKIAGLLCLLLSLYLFISFTSYFFTGNKDQVLDGTTAGNWMGHFGRIASRLFIYEWFGIASYIVPFLLFLRGVKILFGINLLPFGKTLRYSFFTGIWTSTFLGYVFHSSSLLVLAGGYGFQMSQSLNEMIGIPGTGFLLVFAGLTFSVVVFNISFKRIAKEIIAEAPVMQSVVAEGEVIEDVITPNKFIEEEKIEDATQPIELSVEEEEEQEDVEEEENELSLEVVETNVPLAIVESKPDELIDEEVEGALPHAEGEYDPKLDLSNYQYPILDLLENYGDKKIEVNKEELEANKNKIVETLSHYNIGIDKIKATIGPTVTLFEIVPSAGIRISKIKNLEDDIALSLSALGIRIIAPMPGKGTIGIEVPNQKPEIVPMKALLASEKFVNAEMELPIALGKTISNEVFVVDLAKMPHLLMAGATGQGKSVGLNAVLVSLLYKKHPAQVKFVLVDPKKVELTLFKKIEKHFLAKLPGEDDAIITDTKKVVNTLNSLCIEMDQRYDLMKDAQVRNIKEYNTKFIARKLNPTNGHRFLPYIVLVVDEFADLIMTAGKEVEAPIARLAQLARAIGIHLIIATQRPSVNIITGTIKANFPARIAFRVTSKIDSRTILDAGGADQLIGRGDMLLSTGADVIRLQCAFVDTPEVERITNFIGDQHGYADAHLLPEYVDESGEGSKDFDPSDEHDALFNDAARIVVQHQQGSASLLQRRLKLGYNRAGRIIDQLEAARIIGPFEGSKAREVLIKDPQTLEQILHNAESRIEG